MADLLDIADSTAVESVRINGGGRLVVRGLNANAVASIAARYPKVIAMFVGGFSGADLLQSQVMLQFGAAVAPVIAAGCGNLADEEAERRANNLLLEDQAKLFWAIWGLTFPNGLNAFLQVLASFTPSTEEGAKIYRVRPKRSPSSSQPSSEEASRLPMQ